jgi:hypothetical protein
MGQVDRGAKFCTEGGQLVSEMRRIVALVPVSLMLRMRGRMRIHRSPVTRKGGHDLKDVTQLAGFM